MRKRDDNLVDGREMRLRSLPALGTCGSVAHVSHCKLAGKRGEVGVGEDLTAKAQILAHHNSTAVTHRDTRRLLAAMLQRAQAKIRQTSNVALWRPNTKDTALLVQLIPIFVQLLRLGHTSCGGLGRMDGFLRHAIPS